MAEMKMPSMPKFPGMAPGVIIEDETGTQAGVVWERIGTNFNRKKDTSINALGSLSLVDHIGKGRMVGIVLVTNSKDKCKLRVRFENQVTYFDFSPEDVHTYLCTGIGSTTMSSGLGLGCNLWNPTSGYYGIVFAPGQPLTYKTRLEVWLYNSGDSAITILDAWVLWEQIG